MTSEQNFDQLVTSIVPSLSNSLAERFNVFRVMRHGTHEKQLSNVFAWLLDSEGTHDLGEAFQRIFMTRLNATHPGRDLSLSGFRVTQEVDTSAGAETGKDIADIVLTSPTESVVIENFGTSSGHGHDYAAYLGHGALGGRESVVVLLCIRHESELQTKGWQDAVVLTYASLLEDLRQHVTRDKQWQRSHRQQHFFINELVEHFVEGPKAVSNEDRIAFIAAMCETGEAVRFGHRPKDVAAEEFAELLALHAKELLENSRRTLAEVKSSLLRFAEHSIVGQLNPSLNRPLVKAQARFQGQWEFYVRLLHEEEPQLAGLVFGPTAAVYNEAVPNPLVDPDFTKIFVLVKASTKDEVDRLVQTDVGLDEVLAGLGADDTRLAESVLAAVSAS